MKPILDQALQFKQQEEHVVLYIVNPMADSEIMTISILHAVSSALEQFNTSGIGIPIVHIFSDQMILQYNEFEPYLLLKHFALDVYNKCRKTTRWPIQQVWNILNTRID